MNNVLPDDPFARVAVFPLTASLITTRAGRDDGTLQLGRDAVERVLDDNGITDTGLPSGADGQVLALVAGTPTWIDAPIPHGYSENSRVFYDESCAEITDTILTKD